MSLYRKYRPQNFRNLVGQEHIKETLLNELRHGHLTHAYLFAGPRGTGKTSTARLIAKALNCVKLNDEHEEPKKGIEKRAKPAEKIKRIEEIREKELDLDPCEECEFCLAISEGSLIDVIEIDAASNRGIDEIRDLREKIKFAPTRAKTKVYIIDEVHMLTKEAFNALLKTLEEPPPQVYFILATTEVHKIPETIISRCQRFDFKRIDIKTIMTRLNYIAQMEKIEAEDTAIELIARNVQGGLRDAISLFEQMIFEGKLTARHIQEHLGVAGSGTVEKFVDSLSEKNAEKCLNLISEVNQEGYDMGAFLREILEYLREKLIISIREDKNDGSTVTILGMIEILLSAREKLRLTPIPQLPLEIAVIKICGWAEKENSQKQALKKTKPEETDKILNANMLKKYDEREATKAETETAEEIRLSVNEIEMDIDMPNIQRHWQRVLDHINMPSLKRSFSQGKITSFDSGILIIEFSTLFHLDKVKSVENTSIVENAFEKIFGKKVTVKCVLTKATVLGDNKPVKREAPLVDDFEKKEKTASTNPDEKESLAQKALEIFGEE